LLNFFPSVWSFRSATRHDPILVETAVCYSGTQGPFTQTFPKNVCKLIPVGDGFMFQLSKIVSTCCGGTSPLVCKVCLWNVIIDTPLLFWFAFFGKFPKNFLAPLVAFCHFPSRPPQYSEGF